ncbi:MAG: site-specific DNA-methyltransferase [Bacteroidetes bacterium]|nr:site-specific DNA-methyltransferase [Bacteroidota bacterium]
MNGESLNITQDNLDKLQTLFPDIFTEGKIDMEKFKATFSDDINFVNERYVLNWAGKSDAFKVLQIPTTATLKPQPDQSVNFDTTQNVFIEGENLEVLKVLQKSYYGKVKCIIIDPPYNTGNDSFIYPDSFKENKAEYEKRVGDKDEEGYLMKEGLFRKNSKDSGHYHSNWLSMMYPRLFLAKNLLKEDGVVFVHIDDNEVHNLRLLMNEIFGEENFVAQIVWEKRYGRSNDVKFFSSVTDYIILYRKTSNLSMLREPREESNNEIYTNPDNDPRGVWTSVSFVSQRTKEERPNLAYKIINPISKAEFEHPVNSWKYSFTKYNELLNDNRLYWGKEGTQKFPRIKRFLAELPQGLVPVNLWKHQEVGTGEVGTREVDALLGKEVFTYPKPTSLLKKLLKIGSASDSIVMDFFGGSGSTAQAVLELNQEDGGSRKFILVQLPELCEEGTEALKAGYKTIADLSSDRIRKAIAKIKGEKETKKQLETDSKDKENLDLGFKVFKLSPSNFKIWRGNEITEENLVEQLDAFTNPVREESKKDNMLFELILKAGYLLTDKIEVKENFYAVNNGELIIALEEMNEKIIGNIISAQPKKVITLDNLFTGNDQLKTNTVLQMKDVGIDFKTI